MGPDAELTRSEIAQVQRTRRRALPAVRGDARARGGGGRADADDGAARPAAARPRATCGRCSRWDARSGGWATAPARRSRSSPAPARPILDRWFESEELKATLATDAVIGAMASPVDAGHRLRAVPPRHGRDRRQARACGRTCAAAWAGSRRRWRAAARDLGAEIRCDAEVARILVRDGQAVGVALADGDEFHAPVVASNADANVTFLQLLDPSAAARGVRRPTSSGSATPAPR